MAFQLEADLVFRMCLHFCCKIMKYMIIYIFFVYCTKNVVFFSFRQGKFFHYDLPNQDSKAFQDFALGWYKNTPSKNVPAPKTPL